MNLTQENKNNCIYLISVIQAVLNGTAVPLPHNICWDELFKFACAHSVANILYSAVVKLPKAMQPSDIIMAYLRQMYQEQIVTDANLSVETDRILTELDNIGIKCIPLKGILIKNDYPMPHLRTMADVDLLYDAEKESEMHKLMLSNGYIRENKGEKDASYRKNEILHFEMHKALFPDGYPACGFFTEVWGRAEFSENSRIGRLNFDDTYLYMLEHLAHHLESGGAGIRMYMDVYVYLKKHKDKLNRQYIDNVLCMLKLEDFEKHTLKICKNWFSGKENIAISSDEEIFILQSPTFGRINIAYLSETIRAEGDNTSSAKNGFRRVFKKLFPSYKRLAVLYSVVDKAAVLYPVFIPVYWVDRLVLKRNVNTSNIGKYFVSDSSAEAVKLKEIYNLLGLSKRIRGNDEKI